MDEKNLWGHKDRLLEACCSYIEQLGLDAGGESMGQSRRVGGWSISEVEALIGLSRRDIQRACYGGQGGVAILSPQDTTWGRRSYDLEDLAQLYVVKQYRRQGLSLPEVKAEIEEQKEAGKSIEDLLGVQVSRLREQAEEVTGQLLQAEALLAAAKGDEGTSLEKLVSRHLGIRSALDPSLSTPPEKNPASSIETLLYTPGLIDSSGVALAMDVWLGPGSAEMLRSAAEAASLRIQSNGGEHEKIQSNGGEHEK